MVERSLSMREALGSMPRFSIFFTIQGTSELGEYRRLFVSHVGFALIAQLVERSTVDVAAIEWSLVRFRVFGLLFPALRNYCVALSISIQ